MADLSVEVAGVRFANPVLVGSCSLTSDYDKIARLVDAGAGGVITKTISPEPMPDIPVPRQFRAGLIDGSLAVSADNRMTLDEGAELIARVSANLDVPIIANVIGRSDDAELWGNTCAFLEAAGASMVELDLNCHPEDGLEAEFNRHPDLAATEGLSIGQHPAITGRVVRAVRAAVGVPVVSKMTLRAPDMMAVAAASVDCGADVISGVNALHGVAAVDVERAGAPRLPGFDGYALNPICGDALNVLGTKWTILLSKYVSAPYISGSGITTPADVVERIMLGAAAVAVCSTIYLNGVHVLTELVAGLSEFMERHGHSSLAEFRGAASARLNPRNAIFGAPVVARVANPVVWAEVAEDVYRRAELACACICRDGASVGFDEARCTGCSLPQLLAPAGAVEMVRV